MAFMLPMLGMNLISKLIGRKDGGSIPPSNAMERVGTGFPKSKMRLQPYKAVAKKRGGAVKKKGKRRK